MGTRWARALTDVSMGRNREAGSAGLGGVSLSNFSSSGAPGLSPMVWSLPSVIGRIEGGSDPECERTIEEGCRGALDGWFALGRCPHRSPLLSLGISSPWEGQSLQGQQGPRGQSIRMQKIKDMVNTP